MLVWPTPSLELGGAVRLNQPLYAIGMIAEAHNRALAWFSLASSEMWTEDPGSQGREGATSHRAGSCIYTSNSSTVSRAKNQTTDLTQLAPILVHPPANPLPTPHRHVVPAATARIRAAAAPPTRTAAAALSSSSSQRPAAIPAAAAGAATTTPHVSPAHNPEE